MEYKDYRSQFELALAPEGATVKITYLAGCRFMIVWVDCPDLENVLYANLPSRKVASGIVNDRNWKLKTDN